MSRKVSLTGIKPTHVPHLGNYLGAMRPALRLTDRYDGIYFIADSHALTTTREPEKLRTAVYDVTASWLAAGLNPAETLLFRQSDVMEVFELSWVLSCLIATGQLERGVAYKDATAKGESPNSGIFYYPVLMAADILLYDTDIVPIGSDQKQHLELARDVAQRLNHLYGEDTVVVPEPLISDAPLVPGLDGEKMSKSRGNGVPLFAESKALRKVVMQIVSGSETLEAPKDPESSTVFKLYQLVASPEQVQTMAERLRAGGYGWGHAKDELFQVLDQELSPLRERYKTLRDDQAELDRILAQGADRARAIAERTMKRVRKAIGIR